MADLFDEVEGQLRSDRYRTLTLKAAPWVIAALAAALIAALGYWGLDSYRQQQAAKASDAYAAGLAAFEAGREAEAAQKWGEVAKGRAAGYKSLALMQLGGLKIGANKTDEAVALFDQAAEAAPDPVIGDAARLKSAFALLDSKPYKDVEARLSPLMADGRPYRIQAREALAFAKLAAGDSAGARGDFVIVSSTLDASEAARSRAKAAIQLIDSGSAKFVPAAIKAELALPAQVMAVDASGLTNAPPAQPQPQAPGSQ